MIEELREPIARVAGWLREGGAVALTGAGISVDSGIPDFRSRGGLWEKYDPAEYATIDAFRRDPDRVWNMLREMGDQVAGAAPNAGHLGLARLEAEGLLDGIITQNVDDLHQAAGSRTVIEFHGNARRLACTRCGDRTQPDRMPAGHHAPRCAKCEGILRPLIVFFGEPIPPTALRRAADLARSCRTMLVVGTSATVAPASLLPLMARDAGARVVEIDLQETALHDSVDASLIGHSASVVLPLLGSDTII
jgi:NAD-dependent deacetylase